MKSLFWILALFALAVAIALGAQLNDGYVLFVLPPWRAEISLNLLLVLLPVVFVAGYAALRGLLVTLALPRLAREYRARRQREASGLLFQDAVRLLFEGRFGQALKKAGESWQAGVAPGLSALIAARAAQRMREPGKQQWWLEQAERQDARYEAATLMLEAEMLNEERRFSEALAALDKLQSRHGRHIAALRLELRARQGAADWDGVLKLLRRLDKRDALPEEMVGELCTKAHLANIASHAHDKAALGSYLRQLPVTERDGRVVLAAARALVGQAQDQEAQKLIEALIDDNAGDTRQAELLEIYGHLAGGDALSRIARAESWLRRQPDDADLLLALGRMCFRQRLWGKAQSYLEASLSIDESRAAHLELARLCDQLERPDDANRHYRASVALPGTR